MHFGPLLSGSIVIAERGFRIGWAPKAMVHWQLRPNLKETFRKFVLYSKHNVLAGRQRYWHYGIVRQVHNGPRSERGNDLARANLLLAHGLALALPGRLKLLK